MIKTFSDMLTVGHLNKTVRQPEAPSHTIKWPESIPGVRFVALEVTSSAEETFGEKRRSGDSGKKSNVEVSEQDQPLVTLSGTTGQRYSRCSSLRLAIMSLFNRLRT